MEKKIDNLEKELKQIDKQLAETAEFQKLSKQKGFFDKYQQNQLKLNEMVQDWENAVEQLEQQKA